MGRPANLVVNILGNNHDLQKALGQSGGALSSFASTASAVGKGFATAWTITATAAAATTVALFKQGVAYNQLQQTATAAFSTLLGSQKAAAGFMADISAFAKTSPFPKQAFITASQQMVAFGISSKKVIPYLGAIQDAVAAAGGSSQQLSEVAFVMAQIQAAGKITGQDLIQFGQRGINAAELIGQSMGKTGAQIKAAISSGSLDATAALDALAQGMETRYAGAAANVKNTWAGATDRVRGALRDIGSALAEPFVSAQGGGLGVTWANDLATVLRGLIPVVQGVMSGITAAMGPTFDKLHATLAGIGDAVKGLDASGVTGIVSAISGLAPALGGLTGAFAAISGSSLLSSLPVIGPAFAALGGPIGIVVSALAGLIAMSPQLQSVFGGAIQAAFKAIAPVLPAVGAALSAVAKALSGVLAAVAPIIPILGGLFAAALNAVAPILAQIAGAILPLFANALTALWPAIQALVNAFLPLLALIQPLISALLPPLVQILRLVLNAITPLIPIVTMLVTALVQLVVAAVTPLLPVLSKLLTAFMPILSPVLQLVGIFAQLLSALMPLLSPILQLAGFLAGKLAAGIAIVLTSGLKLIAPIFQGIADVLADVVHWVGQVINWFAKLKPPAWLSSIGKLLTTPLSAPAPKSSGVSFTPATMTSTPAGFRGLGTSPFAVGVTTATPLRPVQVIVQAPYKGDEIARTIRRELRSLDRRERGVVLQAVTS